MQEINIKEQKILDFVTSQIENNRKMPTLQDISKATGMKSLVTVLKYLNSLELKGYVKRNRYKYGMQVLENNESLSMTRSPAVPFLNSDTDLIAIPLSLLPIIDKSGKDLFALTIDNDSMSHLGIANNDTIIVHRQQIVEEGDITIKSNTGELLGRVVMSFKQFK